MVSQFKPFNLSALAISVHMDCGAQDAVAMLARRLRFTAGIGARYMITNSSTGERRDALLRTIEANILACCRFRGH